MKITLPSGREIGDGCPPFIVAEIGSNWRTLEDCMTSISQAKACGADAVKFQLFDWDSLYGLEVEFETLLDYENASTEASWNPDIDQIRIEQAGKGKINEHTLLLEWLPKLKEKADAVGIEFMCSAFSPELIDAVDPFVNLHKVASAESTHVRMLERLRVIGKPVFLSTGAHGVEDIRAALSVLQEDWSLAFKFARDTKYEGKTAFEKPPVVLMYCVAAYPAREVQLRAIEVMRQDFGLPIGYSDHSTDVLVIPDRAVNDFGACVIEKHVNFVGADGPDAPHSLSGDQFKAMVHGMYGPHDITQPTLEERPMVLRHNRRLIATRDIAVGDVLTEGQNFGIYRSLKDETHAFHPFMADEINGKAALRDIKVGDGVGPGDC